MHAICISTKALSISSTAVVFRSLLECETMVVTTFTMHLPVAHHGAKCFQSNIPICYAKTSVYIVCRQISGGPAKTLLTFTSQGIESQEEAPGRLLQSMSLNYYPFCFLSGPQPCPCPLLSNSHKKDALQLSLSPLIQWENLLSTPYRVF